MKNYSKQFAVCARVALDSYNPRLHSAERWASLCADEFVSTVNPSVSQAEVANQLQQYFDENYIVPVSLRGSRYFTENGEARSAYSSQVSSFHVADTQEEEASQVEICLGNNAFNRFLFKEYETWYAAFDAEADEDEDEDGPDADTRWTLQAAKKLQRKTGLSLANLVPVVGAWLLKHHES